MTEIAEELMEDVEVGEYVRIRYGAEMNPETAEGKVLGWTSNFLKIERADGLVSKIRLDDSLRSLDQIHQIPLSGKQVSLSNEDKPKQTEDKPQSSKAAPTEFRILRAITPLKPAVPFFFDNEEQLRKVKELLAQSGNSELKHVFHGIFDALDTALKTNQLTFKYHDLRKRILDSWGLCEAPNDFRVFYLFLGVLAIITQHYKYAMEPLVRAKSYTLAAYAATSAKLPRSASLLSICALLSGESSDINQYIAEICSNEKDPFVIDKLLEQNKDDPDFCELLAACAHRLFIASNGKLTKDIGPYDSAYDAAVRLLQAVPPDWMCKDSAVSHWETYRSYTYPKGRQNPREELLPEVEPTCYTGNIYTYNKNEKNGRWGFVGDNHYFYISQVLDDSDQGILLRKMLALGLWNQLEVSYYLGQSPIQAGKSAATQIELTDRGYQDALARIEKRESMGAIFSGVIEAYYPLYGNGSIKSDDGTYYFKLEKIVDPRLKSYYENNNVFEDQKVYFLLEGRNAVEICWRDPSEEMVRLYSGYLPQKVKNQWEEDRKKLEELAKKKISILPEEDPYASYPYINLEDWIPEAATVKRQEPLTWNGVPPVSEEPESDKEEKKKPESPEKSVPHTGISAAIPPIVDPSKQIEARNYTEQARRNRLQQNLPRAAQLFEKALEVGGFNEATMSDYITVLQQLGRIDEALRILVQYENYFPKIKLLNLRIGLYDKKKDYTVLVRLYEQAFQSVPMVSTKSHNLIRLIDCHIKLGNYEEAMKQCQRWETFYYQNRFSTDSEKLKTAATHVSRQRAISLYFQGETEEAREIATSLLRLNPADTAAIGILDGTLAREAPAENNTADTQEDDISWEYDNELEKEGNSTHFNHFVQDKIQEMELSDLLKKNVKEGKYIGDAQQREKDIRFILDNAGTTPKGKSQAMFAICKILEQTAWDGDGSDISLKKRNNAGRGMAAWGDLMVSQTQDQTDTFRMAYLYALTLLNSDQRMEQGWIDSYNRYIKSFFMAAKGGTNSLEAYITDQNKKSGKYRDPINADVFTDGRIQSVLMAEFVVGMLLLVSAISKQSEKQDQFLKDLYKKNPELRQAVCAQLELVLEQPISLDMDQQEFSEKMRVAANYLGKQKDKLERLLTDISDILMKHDRIPGEQLSQLANENWKNYLTGTDFSRLRTIYSILTHAQDFYSSSDFDNRIGCLHSVLQDINTLQQTIRQQPTDLSYDVFLPALSQMSFRLSDARNMLYQDFLPQIEITEALQAFPKPNLKDKIELQLLVKNKENCQAADSFRISNLFGDDVVRLSSVSAEIPSLRGGEEEAVSLSVVITEAAMKSGSFSAKLQYTFTCSDGTQDKVHRAKEKEFNFVIRTGDFEPLTNPFKAYEEHMMDNEAMFFGRSEQIDRIINMIRTPSGSMNYGRAIGMYGQTRTGKTSLLYHLIKKMDACYDKDILIWDLGNLGDLPVVSGDDFMVSFLHRLLSKGWSALKRDKEVMDLLREGGLDEPPLDRMLEQPAFAVTLFNNYMGDLNEIIRENNKLIVLIADEFTYLHGYIQDGRLPNGFMRFWKALLQNNCIFAIIAGQDDMPQFTREYPNEFACMELMKLNYLTEEDTLKLIQEPLERANDRTDLFKNDGCLDQIYELTAGSAYLNILLCSKLVEYLNEKGAYMVTKGIIQDFITNRVFGPNSFLMEKVFEPQIDERGQDLHEINESILLSVARLSQSGGQAASISDIACGTMSTAEIQPYIDRLVDRNVLVRQDGDRYWIQVKLLEKWLINTKGA